jgi:hypothetical protein
MLRGEPSAVVILLATARRADVNRSFRGEELDGIELRADATERTLSKLAGRLTSSPRLAATRISLASRARSHAVQTRRPSRRVRRAD